MGAWRELIIVEDFQRRSCFEELFRAHAGAVRAYARRRIGRGDADDTVSEVFAIAWRRLDDVPEDARDGIRGAGSARSMAMQRRSVGCGSG